MIVFLLLVIVAILLLGSSAVIGAIGAILGFVVAIAALTALALWLNIGADQLVLWLGVYLPLTAIACRLVYLAAKPSFRARSDARLAHETQTLIEENERLETAAKHARQEAEKKVQALSEPRFRLQNANPNRRD